MAMVHATGAHSTDLLSEEPVDHLCGKCKNYAATGTVQICCGIINKSK